MRSSLVTAAAVVGALFLAHTAHADENDNPSIIGGDATSEHPAVGQIVTFDGKCTATLIAPRVMLTAAHCVVGSVVNGTRRGTARFGTGPGEDDFETVDIINMVPHPNYSLVFVRENDVGLVLLQDDPPGNPEPMPWNEGALEASLIGTLVEVVGYGVTDGEAQTGGDLKRSVNLAVDELRGDELIGMGNTNTNICQGDSGGPTLLTIDGVPTIIAVSSFGSNQCKNPSFVTRTDAFRDFIAEVVAAWSGPCQRDLDCVTEGCGEFADPDCDICGLDNVCAANCEKVDLDCYVSRGQGAACTRAEECGSSICDTGNGICVTPCPQDGECPEPYSCVKVDSELSVCTVGGGGCCQVAGKGGWPAPGSVLFALGLAAILWQVLGRSRSARVRRRGE